MKNVARMQTIGTVGADIWVLTETSDAIRVHDHRAPSTPIENYHGNGECLTAIHSRWPIGRVHTTWDALSCVCAEVTSPVGPLVVYGTVVPYANYRGLKGTSRRWQEHRAAIAELADDLRRIRALRPEAEFVLAGDFNQSRDGSGWYEDAQSVAALTEALQEAGLTCVTQQPRQQLGLEQRSTVDHICLSDRLVAALQDVWAWSGSTQEGLRMSDHNGIGVRLSPGGT